MYKKVRNIDLTYPTLLKQSLKSCQITFEFDTLGSLILTLFLHGYFDQNIKYHYAPFYQNSLSL